MLVKFLMKMGGGLSSLDGLLGASSLVPAKGEKGFSDVRRPPSNSLDGDPFLLSLYKLKELGHTVEERSGGRKMNLLNLHIIDGHFQRVKRIELKFGF